MPIPDPIGTRVRAALAAALEKHGITVPWTDIKLEYPLDLGHGDYATGTAMRFAKQAGRSPLELAHLIVESLGTLDGVEKIDIAAPGFINFTLSAKEIAE